MRIGIYFDGNLYRLYHWGEFVASFESREEAVEYALANKLVRRRGDWS